MNADQVIISAAAFEGDEVAHVFSKFKKKYIYLECGIGSIAAAKNAVKISEICANKEVLFIGTCGSFEPFLKPTLLTTSRIAWAPTCTRIGAGYTVMGSAPDIILSGPASWLRSLADKTVVCSPSISLTPQLTPEFSQFRNAVENLELYSCAKEIKDSAASFSVLLCITNEIGKNAHKQWLQFKDQARIMTADFIEKNYF